MPTDKIRLCEIASLLCRSIRKITISEKETLGFTKHQRCLIEFYKYSFNQASFITCWTRWLTLKLLNSIELPWV